MIKTASLSVACLALAAFTFAQNRVGINNIDPKAALDINGSLRLRQQSTNVTGTTVQLASNRTNHLLTGSPSGDFDITFSGTIELGQHLIITNSTSFNGFLPQITIPPNVTAEFTYSGINWQLIGSNEAKNAWWLTGNFGTTISNYIGTADAQPIRFRINNNPAGSIDLNGNTAYGYLAMSTTTVDAQDNTAMGYNALKSLKIGVGNIGIGRGSANSQKYGNHNIAIGVDALATDSTGSETVAIGYNALAYNQNRFGNTAVGTNSLFNNSNPDLGVLTASQGLHNTALGHSALFNNRRGSGAVAIGYQAAYRDNAAEGVIAIGRNALFNNNGKVGNIAIGDSALFNNSSGATTDLHAKYNTAIGSHALFNNTTGYGNIAIGYQSMAKNIVGVSNLSIGSAALSKCTNGNENTALGYSSLSNLNTGSQNIAIGGFSFSSLTFGSNNIGMGQGTFALRKGNRNILIVSATSSTRFDTDSINDNLIIGHHENFLIRNSSNVFIGNHSGGNQILGSANTGIGDSALYKNESGENNVSIGFKSGGAQNGNANVFVGYKAGYNATGSNKLYIENSDANKDNALIYGDFAADSLNLNAKVNIRDFTRLGTQASGAPAIKTKKITGFTTPTSANPNSFTFVPHGLTASKILSISVLINTVGNYEIMPQSTQSGYTYSVNTDPSGGGQANIAVGVKSAAESSNVMGRPIKIFITYEE